MTARHWPHPFIPTLLGALVGVAAHQVAAFVGASGRSAFGVAVVTAMLLGVTLGSVARKIEPPE